MRTTYLAGIFLMSLFVTGSEAGYVSGSDGLALFDAAASAGDMTLVDFDGMSGGTRLPPYGSPPQVPGDVSFRTVEFGSSSVDLYVLASTLYPGQIVGTRCNGCVDDGRGEYEIVFETPQQAVGVSRLFSSAITQFENAAGELLFEYSNGPSTDFVGYYSDSSDPAMWVTRLFLTGDAGDTYQQTGYTDNLFYGTFVIPEPSAAALCLVGMASVFVTRRRLRNRGRPGRG